MTSIVTALPENDPAEERRLFDEMIRRDFAEIERHPWLAKWLLADSHEARGTRKDMNFRQFRGPGASSKIL